MPPRKKTEISENDDGPLPRPEANSVLLGHETAEAELLAALKSGRMHHAWLISGPKGVGKATLAFRFARFLLRYGGDPAALARATSFDVPEGDPISRQVASGAAQDMLVMRREISETTGKLKKDISVDAVRRLQNFFALSAGAGGWRVAIVDSVDELNRNSSNALLKSLEEPPQRSVLLLVANAPSRTLPTIRSRCRTLPLTPMNEAKLAESLPALGSQLGLPSLQTGDQKKLASLARGSVGRALDLWANGGLAVSRAVDAALAQWPDIRAASLLGEARGNFEAASEILIATLRDTARRGALGEPTFGKGVSAAVWSELAAEIEELFIRGEDVNLDERAMMGEALRRIAGAGSRVVPL
jgi:DNA polymerase-3 subunit delta'